VRDANERCKNLRSLVAKDLKAGVEEWDAASFASRNVTLAKHFKSEMAPGNLS
jgi:hypothetical protein